MKKKKILKITALVIALLLTSFLAVFVNALVGNPISALLVKNGTEKHLELNYANEDFYPERISYDFKSSCYNAFILSPSSPDSSFSLSLDFGGKVLWDSYEDRVLGRWNTSERINKQYRQAVDAVFDSVSFPYETHISFGDIEFVEKTNLDQPYIPDYAIVTDDLELDGYYDIGEMGKRAGRLTVYVNDEQVSIERMSEILLGIKSIMNKSGVEFKVIDCVLEPLKSEDGYKGGYSGEERLEVQSFPCEEIYEKGMQQRTEKAVKEAEDLRRQQDSIKQAEIDAYEKAVADSKAETE